MTYTALSCRAANCAAGAFNAARGFVSSMQFKAFIFGISCLTASPAFAWDLSQQGPGVNAGATTDSGQAQSQNAISRSKASATSLSLSSSGARSASKSTGNVTTTNVYAGNSSSNQSAAGGASSGSNSGGGLDRVQFPPATAYAAPLAGGPCNSSGVSGGAQTAWFGISVAHQRFDYGCAGERMGNMMTIGQKLDWAYQCADDDKFRKASASIGMPCPQDQKKEEEAEAPKPTLVSDVEPPRAAHQERPDWCFTARPRENPAERRRYAELCRR